MLLVSSYTLAEVLHGGQTDTRYTYIQTVKAGLNISGASANCKGEARGKNTDTTTHVLVRLQRRVTGTSTWHTEASWTSTASGQGVAYVDTSYPVNTGNDYRVKTLCQIKDSNGDVLETAYAYSSIWSI